MSNWQTLQRGFAAAADCELHDQCAQNKCIVIDDGASCTVNGELALTSSLHALQPAHSCLLLILTLLYACHLLLSCVKPTILASQCPCVYHYITKADTAPYACNSCWLARFNPGKLKCNMHKPPYLSDRI